jgi:hypothetical protein
VLAARHAKRTWPGVREKSTTGPRITRLPCSGCSPSWVKPAAPALLCGYHHTLSVGVHLDAAEAGGGEFVFPVSGRTLLEHLLENLHPTGLIGAPGLEPGELFFGGARRRSSPFWCAQFGLDQATRADHADYVADYLGGHLRR